MSEVKRYNMALPADLFKQVEEVAQEKHCSKLEVIKTFIKMGLEIYRAQKGKDATGRETRIMIEKDGKKREITFII